MTIEVPRVAPEWLSLRERADAEARAPESVALLAVQLPRTGTVEVHDLGCGTGSMTRWLAPQLQVTQRWVLHDRDPDLLALAVDAIVRESGSSAAGSVTTRCDDVTRLPPDALDGASLITASALLDMLTENELERLVDACLAPGCPVLFSLSVTGSVTLTPSDPLDEILCDAFNSHQQRLGPTGRLLGPDAAPMAKELFSERGRSVLMAPSPWLLGAADGALITEWLSGWVGAACAQRPELTQAAARYLSRRRAQALAGQLRVLVNHADVLAFPRPSRRLPHSEKEGDRSRR